MSLTDSTLWIPHYDKNGNEGVEPKTAYLTIIRQH